MHGVTEADLRTLIETETGVDVLGSITDIRLYEAFTFVYISEENAKVIIDKLNGIDQFGRRLNISYSKKNIQ